MSTLKEGPATGGATDCSSVTMLLLSSNTKRVKRVKSIPGVSSEKTNACEPGKERGCKPVLDLACTFYLALANVVFIACVRGADTNQETE